MSIRVQGHRVYINLSIPLPYKYRGGGVAVFRKNNGKVEVLLGLRLNRPGKGKWSFPGGGAEGKEKLITAGVREFREEVGVQLLGRYITKVGVYKIQNPLFDWETQVIETTQNIDPKGIGAWWRTGDSAKNYGGEFSTLEWVALEDIGKLRLHRWVREVVKVYQSDQMKPYIAQPSEKKRVYKPSSAYRALQDEFDFLGRPGRRTTSLGCVSGQKRNPGGSDLLFDIAEMILLKTDPDGTRYYKPRYAPAVVAKHSKARSPAWK
jgi:8-oxo-dGTP pyrophosphatase MutT (NUDIX family)